MYIKNDILKFCWQRLRCVYWRLSECKRRYLDYCQVLVLVEFGFKNLHLCFSIAPVDPKFDISYKVNVFFHYVGNWRNITLYTEAQYVKKMWHDDIISSSSSGAWQNDIMISLLHLLFFLNLLLYLMNVPRTLFSPVSPSFYSFICLGFQYQM